MARHSSEGTTAAVNNAPASSLGELGDLCGKESSPLGFLTPALPSAPIFAKALRRGKQVAQVHEGKIKHHLRTTICQNRVFLCRS